MGTTAEEQAREVMAAAGAAVEAAQSRRDECARMVAWWAQSLFADPDDASAGRDDVLLQIGRRDVERFTAAEADLRAAYDAQTAAHRAWREAIGTERCAALDRAVEAMRAEVSP